MSAPNRQIGQAYWRLAVQAFGQKGSFRFGGSYGNIFLMSKRTYTNKYGFQTRAVHTGNDVDSETGAIKRPITMANSYELPYDPTEMNWSSAAGNLYTRNGGSNQKYLQEKLASLEGGEDCVVLASGVAALSGLFFCEARA